MNYKTLTEHVFMSAEASLYTSKDLQMAHLHRVRAEMARALAERLVHNEFGNIECDYDIKRQGYRYTMSVKLWREHDES